MCVSGVVRLPPVDQEPSVGSPIGAGVAVSLGSGSAVFVCDGSTFGAFDFVATGVGTFTVSTAGSACGGSTSGGWVAAPAVTGTAAAEDELVAATGNLSAA